MASLTGRLGCWRKSCGDRWSTQTENLSEGVVEVDQAEIPFREGDTFFEPGNAGKILVIGAVEVIDRDTNQPRPRRRPRNISIRVPAASASP